MDDMASVGLRVDSRPVRTASGDLDRFARSGDGAGRSATSATGAIGGMSIKMVAAVAAAGALAAALTAGAMLNRFIDATVTAEASQAQLGAAILSTGGAAGRSISQLNEHAAALQRVTNFGDEATNAMQGVLLTFTQVRGDQFDAATVAVMDLATAMGTDLSTAALQVGRALNDPVLGMTALSRSGIQFTEAQKEMVRQLVASNDVIGAQTIILAELETQFGGSAAAARDTLGGALGSLRNAFGDLFELSGPGSEALRASIERLTAAVAKPEFFAAVQAIGTGLFKAAEIGVNALVGLSEAFTTLADNLDLVAISVGVLGAMKVPALVIGLSAMATSGALAAGAMATLALAMNLIPAVALFTGLALAATTLYRGFTESAAAAVAFEGAIARVVSVQDALNTATERFYNNVTQRNLDAMLQVARDAVATAETALDAARAEAEAASFMVTLFGGGVGVDRLTEAADAVTQLALDLFDAETSLAAAEHAAANFASGLGDAEDNAGGTAAQVNAINFSNIIAGADALAARLGVSLGLARSIAAVAGSQGLADPGDEVFDPRSRFFNANAQRLANIEAERARNAEYFSEAAQSARALSAALAASSGGGSGGGGSVATAAAAAGAKVEELTTFAQGMGAALQGGTKDAVEMGREFGGSLLRGIGSVSDAFGDFIMRGFTDFKGFVSSILDSFKSMLSQMISMALRNRIMLSIGAAGKGGIGQAAAGAAGKGGIGGGGMLGGLLGSFGSGGGILGMSGLGGGTGLLGGLGNAVSGGLGNIFSIGANAAAAGGGILATLGAAVPIIGAVALAFSFFKKKTTQLDAGIMATVSGMDTLVQTFSVINTKRFFGLSNKTRTHISAADKATTDAVTGMVDTLQGGVLASADALGIAGSTFENFAYSMRISTRGLSEDAANKAIQDALTGMADGMAGMVSGLSAFATGGEGSAATLDRLAQSLILVNARMADLGLRTNAVSLAGGGAAAAFAGLFGSLENFNAVSQSYYQNFYTDAERVARATELLSIEMLALGIDTLPATRAAFRAMVDEADALGDTGLVASLMQLSPAFAEITRAADELNTSLSSTTVFRTLADANFARTSGNYQTPLDEVKNNNEMKDLLREVVRAIREGDMNSARLTDRLYNESRRANMETLL